MLKFVGLLCAGMIASGAYAQSCPEIRFAPGTSSGVVSGEVEGEGIACFRFGAGSGQTARVRVIADPQSNLCLGIVPEVECTELDYSWTTSSRSYEIRVGHMFRAAHTTPFKLELSIR